MAPPAKSKKTRIESGKSKYLNLLNSATTDSKAVDSDWWNSFWPKNSSIPGSTVPTDEDEAFKHFFRVSKPTFHYICSLVREDLVSRPPSGLINIEGRLLTVEKQVAIALRRLASGDSQVSVGHSFSVGQSTVSQITWRFIESLEIRARSHLRWPDRSNSNSIKSRFDSLSGLPNCVAAIGATRVTMTLPAVQSSDDWRDAEQNYSMLLQGIVDDSARFIDVVTGYPGAMSVSKLLECSGFYKACKSGSRLEIGEEFVVGGVEYPLLPWLLTPYGFEGGIGNNNFDPRIMSRFNERHERARRVAARAFWGLKGSWRILKKVLWRPDKRKLPSIILACCLLHNIIIDRGDSLGDNVLLFCEDDLECGEGRCNEVDPMGRIVRDRVSQYLYNSLG